MYLITTHVDILANSVNHHVAVQFPAAHGTISMIPLCQPVVSTSLVPAHDILLNVVENDLFKVTFVYCDKSSYIVHGKNHEQPHHVINIGISYSELAE